MNRSGVTAVRIASGLVRKHPSSRVSHSFPLQLNSSIFEVKLLRGTTRVTGGGNQWPGQGGGCGECVQVY